jgi:hypothetical protein
MGSTSFSRQISYVMIKEKIERRKGERLRQTTPKFAHSKRKTDRILVLGKTDVKGDFLI